VNDKLIGLAFDHWTLSGISQFSTGTPAAVSFTTTNSENLNGGGDPQRVDGAGNAFSGNLHSFSQWFNTAAFALPGMNDPGNAGKYDVRQPGVNNNDMTPRACFPTASDLEKLSGKKREGLFLLKVGVVQQGGSRTTCLITRSLRA
jgi:hypothetical protein